MIFIWRGRVGSEGRGLLIYWDCPPCRSQTRTHIRTYQSPHPLWHAHSKSTYHTLFPAGPGFQIVLHKHTHTRQLMAHTCWRKQWDAEMRSDPNPQEDNFIICSVLITVSLVTRSKLVGSFPLDVFRVMVVWESNCSDTCYLIKCLRLDAGETAPLRSCFLSSFTHGVWVSESSPGSWELQPHICTAGSTAALLSCRRWQRPVANSA